MFIRKLCVAIAALFLVSATVPAFADSMTWLVKNEHPNIVDMKFYAVDEGKQGQWPEEGKVYSLDDEKTYEFTLSCETGERICMGAWLRGAEDSIWGVGRNASQSCESCCYVCDGGKTTPVQVISE